MSNLTGKTLGRYQIMEPFGRGGLAVVYRAYVPALDLYVAVKALGEYLTQDANFAQRFRRETEALSRLSHPNIVAIVDAGIEQGIPYLAMDLLQGGTLQQRLNTLNRQPLPLAEVVRSVAQLLGALEYAHDQEMLHLDIRPSNIFLTKDGCALLMDFGLSTLVGGELSSALMGMPAYMAPEQAMGGKPDRRSDLYSLGIALYQMVTGQLPFEAELPMAVALKQLHAPLPLPRQFNPQLPESVERVLLKVLSKKPEDRYQSAREMAEAINKITVATLDSATLPDITLLRRTLVERFSLQELYTLCADLHVSHDELEAKGLEAEARELIAYLQRRERLGELVSYIRQHRPDIKL
jgi:serine/threonine protein kinase